MLKLVKKQSRIFILIILTKWTKGPKHQIEVFTDSFFGLGFFSSLRSASLNLLLHDMPPSLWCKHTCIEPLPFPFPNMIRNLIQGITFGVDAAKSLILMCAVIDRQITVKEAVHLARLGERSFRSICSRTSDVDPVLAKNWIQGLYLKRREIF